MSLLSKLDGMFSKRSKGIYKEAHERQLEAEEEEQKNLEQRKQM